MGRQPTANGGRPVVVSVRLSEDEAATLDLRRGDATRGNYLRSLIPHLHKIVLEDNDPYTPERPGTEVPHMESHRSVTELRQRNQPQNDTVEKHHHKPGKLLDEWFEKGTKHYHYQCAHCEHIIDR